MDNTEDIGKIFYETIKKLSGYMREKIGTKELTLAQSILVGQLYKHGRMKISELSKALDLSKSTISGIVDRLEKNNTLKRIRSEKDRRVVYVQITDEFHKKHASFEASIEGELDKLLKNVEKKDKEAVLKGVIVLGKILDRAIRTGEGTDEKDI